MKYDLSNKTECDLFLKDCQEHIDRGNRIEVKRLKDKRTLDQNAYLWILFTLAGAELGYTKDEMHDICVFHVPEFEKYFIKEIKGKKIMKVRVGTSRLDKEQMSLFIDDFRHFMKLHYSINLPDAEEYRMNSYILENECEKVDIITEKFKQ